MKWYGGWLAKAVGNRLTSRFGAMLFARCCDLGELFVVNTRTSWPCVDEVLGEASGVGAQAADGGPELVAEDGDPHAGSEILPQRVL